MQSGHDGTVSCTNGLRGRCGPPVNLSEVVSGTIKAEGTANATGDKQRACLP